MQSRNIAFWRFLGYNSKKHRKAGSIMEEQILNEQQEQPRQRRRRKSKLEILKETYFPYMFLLGAAVLIIIFIIGALVRG